MDELEAISSLQRVSGWQATRRYLIRHLRVASGIRVGWHQSVSMTQQIEGAPWPEVTAVQERHAQQLEALDANHKVPGHENLVVACADKQVCSSARCQTVCDAAQSAAQLSAGHSVVQHRAWHQAALCHVLGLHQRRGW